jgi:ferredoxin
MKSMLMKVTVDQNICASSGNCVMNAPEVFDQRDEDGVVILLTESPSAEQAEGARQAAAACPAQAIYIEE